MLNRSTYRPNLKYNVEPMKVKSTFQEIKEMQMALKDLKRDSTQQLKLEIESQQSFEFLSAQVRRHGTKPSMFHSFFNTLLCVIVMHR